MYDREDARLGMWSRVPLMSVSDTKGDRLGLD